MQVTDGMAHAKLLAAHREWDASQVTLLTCALTPGSVSLTAWALTTTGFTWARQPRDASNLAGWTSEHYSRRALLLTDKLKGWFLVPSSGVWNYAFQGVHHASDATYSVKLDQPIEFYHELHRAGHFLAFAQLESQDANEAAEQDLFE
jgi:pre-mRNA-processing factor 8